MECTDTRTARTRGATLSLSCGNAGRQEKQAGSVDCRLCRHGPGLLHFVSLLHFMSLFVQTCVRVEESLVSLCVQTCVRVEESLCRPSLFCSLSFCCSRPLLPSLALSCPLLPSLALSCPLLPSLALSCPLLPSPCVLCHATGLSCCVRVRVRVRVDACECAQAGGTHATARRH